MVLTFSPLASLFDAFVDGVEPIARRLRPRRRWVAVEDGDGFLVYRAGRHGTEAVGRLAVGDRLPRRLRPARYGRLELRLDPERLMSRSLNLPAGGRDYLEAILEHRLDRLTPWRPDKVAYGYAVKPGAEADGSLAVDFAAAARDHVEAAEARLSAAGLAASAVGSAAEPIETPLRIDLRRGAADVGRRRLRRGLALALIIVFALLLPAAGVSQYLALAAEAASADLDARLRVKQAVVRRAIGAGAAEGRDRELMAGKTEASSVALIIDRLAALLPDDTVLRELSVDRTGVRLAGRSANAPALIGLIEADPGLSGAAFAAPVLTADDGRQDFDIAARRDGAAPAEAGTEVGGAAP